MFYINLYNLIFYFIRENLINWKFIIYHFIDRQILTCVSTPKRAPSIPLNTRISIASEKISLKPKRKVMLSTLTSNQFKLYNIKGLRFE